MRLTVFILTLSIIAGCCYCITPTCEKCPFKGNIPGLLLRDEFKEDKTCKCPHPVEFCLETAKLCPVRQTCAMRKISDCLFKPCTINSAKCVPFKKCPKFDCQRNCKTGYLVDKNNCKRCYCKDVCKEIDCPPQNCTIREIPGELPIVRCENKKLT